MEARELLTRLWSEESRSYNTEITRVQEDDKNDFCRASHGYERSQCRTTHKRQDC